MPSRVEPDLEDQRRRQGIALLPHMTGPGEDPRCFGGAVSFVHEMDLNPAGDQTGTKQIRDPLTPQRGLAAVAGLGQRMPHDDRRNAMLTAERFDKVDQGSVASSIMRGMRAGQDALGIAESDSGPALAWIECEDDAHQVALSRWPSPGPRPRAGPS